MKRQDITSSTRMGGLVKRYHTWPTLQAQQVDGHTWQVMRIYFLVFGIPPAPVYTYLMFHDVPEVRSGDLPFPIKAQNPALKAMIDELEDETLAGMLGNDMAREVLTAVTDIERVRMKAADLLEMYEFGWLEVRMGNRLASPIVNDTLDALLGLALDEQDHKRIREYIDNEIIARYS